MKEISTEIIVRCVLDETNALKSTQTRLCLPIIRRIYKKMKAGIQFAGIKVDDDVIIDGHHRYIASLLAGVSLIKHPSNKLQQQL